MSDSCSRCHYLVNECICIEHRQCIAQIEHLHDICNEEFTRLREERDKLMKDPNEYQACYQELCRVQKERDRLKEELAEKRLVWAINERYRKALENLVDAISKRKERSISVRVAYSEAQQALSGVDEANGDCCTCCPNGNPTKCNKGVQCKTHGSEGER